MAVVSASRDGQYIADFISTLGIASLRGSSSKRGLHAQLAAIRAMRDGYHVSFTPDGPRGPRYQMKNGPIQLASLSGRKIIPISLNASRYWSVRSWDRFQIPKPFSRITLELGEAIEIPPTSTRKPWSVNDSGWRPPSWLLPMTESHAGRTSAPETKNTTSSRSTERSGVFMRSQRTSTHRPSRAEA